MATSVARFNTCDFFLWVEYKLIVYKTGKPQSRNQLIKKIKEAGEVLRANPEAFVASTLSVIRRARLCIEVGVKERFENVLN